MAKTPSRGGGFRWNDPSTSVAAAKTVNVAANEYAILCVVVTLPGPRNGSEIAAAIGWPRDSVANRLCSLRRKGMVLIVGTRPGPPPKFKTQEAYVITSRGQAFLAHVQRAPSLLSGGAEATP